MRAMTCSTRLLAAGTILGTAVLAHAAGWLPMGAYRGLAINVERGSGAWYLVVLGMSALAAGLVIAGVALRRPQN